mgnify:CR=1 FL=1
MVNRVALDWLVIGIFAFALVAFFMFIPTRAGAIQGKVVQSFQAPSSPACETLSQTDAHIVYSPTLHLCSGLRHVLPYFDVRVFNLDIFCNGSTLKALDGGTLFVSQLNPSITLHNCTLEGFDALYSSTQPARVVVESN